MGVVAVPGGTGPFPDGRRDRGPRWGDGHVIHLVHVARRGRGNALGLPAGVQDAIAVGLGGRSGAGPAAEPALAPALRPMTDPTLRAITDPALRPVTDPTLRPVPDPTLRPVPDPAFDRPLAPAVSQAAVAPPASGQTTGSGPAARPATTRSSGSVPRPPDGSVSRPPVGSVSRPPDGPDSRPPDRWDSRPPDGPVSPPGGESASRPGDGSVSGPSGWSTPRRSRWAPFRQFFTRTYIPHGTNSGRAHASGPAYISSNRDTTRPKRPFYHMMPGPRM